MIDKVAWIELAELIWLSASDTARIGPVDHLIFARLHTAGLLEA